MRFITGTSPPNPRGIASSLRKSCAARAAICLGVRMDNSGSMLSSNAGMRANVCARDLMMARAARAARAFKATAAAPVAQKLFCDNV